MTTLLDKAPKFDNEAYCNSPEWKAELEKARKAVNSSYTVIYQDENTGEPSEAWHYMNEDEIDYIKAKYKAKGKIVRIIEPKDDLAFGARLEIWKESFCH